MTHYSLRRHRLTPEVSRHRGFTLYYAVLFGSIILAIGASMLNLSLKEFLLSSSLKESEYAFFAADSGTECVLYWDLHGIPVTFPRTAVDGNANLSQIQCNGASISPAPVVSSASANYATTTFSYNISDSSGTPKYGVVLEVGKQVSSIDGSITTTIISRGYNVLYNSTSNRKIERAIVTQY